MNAKVRTRLSPEARKKQLLDTAKTIILEDGLQAFTMDALAKAAGVTTPLVYNYFATRQTVLQALLEQEYGDYASKLAAAVANAATFEETVRAYITSNFDHQAPGSILPILQSQPDIVAVIDERLKRDGNQTANYVVQQTAASYKLTKPQAELLASMSSGASIAAAQYAARSRVNRKKTIEKVLKYVMAGLDALAHDDN